MKSLLVALARLAVPLLALAAAPAHAGEVDVWLEAESRAVHSDRAVVDGDSIEASGIGTSLDGGFSWTGGRTEVQFDLGAAVFDFTDEDRSTRTSLRAVASVAHEIVPDVTIAVAVGHWDDITTLEARETDQDAVGVSLAYASRPHRLRAEVQYLAREYAGAVPSTGEALRYEADYTYRFAAWTWARLDLRAEDVDSKDDLRGYERQTIRLSGSVPLDSARRWRLRPQVEWRGWTYDKRTVEATAIPREESYVAPEIGLAYGKTEGLKARLRAAYQFRTSNDPRYRRDAPYIDLAIGYRF